MGSNISDISIKWFIRPLFTSNEFLRENPIMRTCRKAVLKSGFDSRKISFDVLG